MIRRRIKVRRRGERPPKTELPFIGSLEAPVWMIVDPVVGNLNAKTPLNKSQLEWFAGHAQEAGKFRRDDVCIISCAPPCSGETWGLGKLIGAHLKEHRPELLRLIDHYKPKFVMPFGAKACQQLVGRAVQITKVRGQPFMEPDIANGVPVLPMLSPFYAQRQPENEAAFVADMHTASRIYLSDYDIEASAIDYKHDYQWCYDLEWLIKQRPKRLSVDIESVGLIPFDPKTTMLTVQICWAPGKTVIVPINYDRGKLRHHGFIPWKQIDRKKLIRQVRQLMEDPRIEKVGQNFKFDWLHLYYQLGIRTENYVHDTMLLAHLHDENQRRINIDDLVRQHVPEMAGFNDVYNNDPTHCGKTRMDLLPPESMLPYGCGDADAALRLTDILLDKVGQDAALLQCYDKVTMPAQRAFCHIEQNGFPVSIEELRRFEAKLRKHQKTERIRLLKQIPKTIRDKWRDSGVGLKVTRAAILRDWLYEHEDGLNLTPMAYTKTKQPSISSKQALPYYVADNPVIADLIDYIKNDKLLNTYVKGFYKYIYDEMIRPSYGLAGTVTGRSMSRDPNGQNFPKRGKLAKEYRRIFKAPPGWVFVACDLSQAELRIAAMMSGDPNMLAVYANGGDIHKNTAAGVMGLSLEEFEALPDDVQGLKRFQAKAINFGFLYGMWWVKFRSYAKTEYGIDFTEEEAQQIRQLFFRTYPMLEEWHRDVQNIVTRQGFIRTFDGRVRHLPNVFSPDEGIAKQAQRQAINSPVQSIASDLGLMTLGRIIPYIREKGYDEWFKPCGFIHDAIVVLVREDKAAQGCAMLKRFMENNPVTEWFDWEPEIPITADAEVGRTLADTYELKPDQFMGKNRGRSYADLVGDEYNAVASKLRKETDADKRGKLEKQLQSIAADLALSGITPSTPTRQKRIIKLKRSTIHHAQRKAAKLPARRTRKLRKAA